MIVQELLCAKRQYLHGDPDSAALSVRELYAQTHENFRILGFLSVPASSDGLVAARRQVHYAGKGSGV